MNITSPGQSHSFGIVAPRLQMPVMRGIIDRRILVNFRCRANMLARVIPPPFRVKLVRDQGVAGICLIRLAQLGPRWLPRPLELDSENAAHRIAVEWDEAGNRREGVFIPRRDTDSRMNQLAGGRFFPGVHHHAEFRTAESPTRIHIDVRSDDGKVRVTVSARTTDVWPGNSVFRSMDEASAFFQTGSLGWSARNDPGEFDGIELRTHTWRMEPLIVERVESSYFNDVDVFPNGSVEFDSAFLMRGIEHEWHGRGRMKVTEVP
jgi:hypothetical protein